jgi:hypothetical protein
MATVAAPMNTAGTDQTTSLSRTGTAATTKDAVPTDEWQQATGREAATESTDRAWTIESIRGLGMTTDVETAASILGFGRTKAYELAKSGDFPVRLLRIGRRYVVPVPAILRLLGAE